MKKPVIGVSPLWDEEKKRIWMRPQYLEGLEEAGAVPVVLPLPVSETALKQIADSFDGFLFTGGGDMDPVLYGQVKADYCGEICEPRDKMETFLFREAIMNLKKPALGICRGMQLFNVMFGGSLYQDIPAEFSKEIDHEAGPPYDVHAHGVRLLPESPLCKLVGSERLEVNSNHHQSINRLAEGLEVMALADDGVVEAVYAPARPYVWAVQWHPELLLKDEASKKLFASFVESIK